MRDKIFLRCLLLIIVAYLAAFITEYLFTFDYSEFLASSRSSQSVREVNIEDCTLEGYEIVNGWLVPNSDDSKIIVTGINCQVDNLQLRVRELSTSAIDIQLFYTDNAPFSEENSTVVIFAENEYARNFQIGNYVSDIRIDIGNSQDVSCIVDSIIINPHEYEYIYGHIFNMSEKRILIYFIGWIFLFLTVYDWDMVGVFLFKYRWLIGFAAICFATVLKLHGSSIGFITEYLTGVDSSRLLGTERAIRSDEFVAFTEMALSQSSSGFKWFSDIWGYSPSDMFIVYGQPVKNLMTIYRPFSLGYLFWGAEHGIAFYWSARTVLLFLVSIEFGRLISIDNRKISVLYALLVTFSPVVQWWFSTNEFVEMLIFGQAAILLLDIFLRTGSLLVKSASMLGIVICAGGYVLALYPALMVPLFYVFGAYTIGYLIERKSAISIKKNDIVLGIVGILLLGLSMLYVFRVSGHTIELINNTVYPGKRVYPGGTWDIWIRLFRGWTSYLWSFIDIDNPCEEVCFFSFFPIGIIFSIILFKKNRIKDPILIALNICNFPLITYLIVPTPAIWGTISLLDHSSPRILTAIGFLNLIILMRAMVLLKTSDKSIRIVVPIAAIISALAVIDVQQYLKPSLKAIVMVVIAITVYMLFNYDTEKRQPVFEMFIIALVFIGGVIVNPVQSGLSSLYNAKDVQDIKVVNDEEDGLWLVNSPHFFLTNLPTVVGAHTVNALATYPDVQLWKDLGLESQADVWNRYSYVPAVIDQTTSLEYVQPDLIKLHISMDDIKRIGVKYIYSRDDLSSSDKVVKIKDNVYRVN